MDVPTIKCRHYYRFSAKLETSMPDPTARKLVVSRESLTLAAKRLKRATTEKRLKQAHLVLRFDDEHLVLEIPGAADSVPATGHWPGLLRVPAVIFFLFAKGEPPADPVEFSVDDEFLHVRAGVAKLKWAAHWEDISPPRLEVALDAPDRELLKLALDFPAAQILSSGLEKSVAAAEKRFQDAVVHAYAAMKCYGINRPALEAALRLLVIDRSKK
jgi:hypothetical protein